MTLKRSVVKPQTEFGIDYEKSKSVNKMYD